MANQTAEDRWIIDTPSATPVTKNAVYIRSVRWTGEALVGTGGTVAKAIITDQGGKVRLQMDADGPVVNLPAISVERWWWDGFVVPQLDGGVLIIDIR